MRTFLLITSFLVMALLWTGNASAAEPESQPVVAACNTDMTYVQLELKGDELRSAKSYDEAIHCYKTALRKSNKNSQLENKIGIAYMLAGEYREAERHLRIAIKADKNNAEANNNLGVIAYARRDYGDAVKYYKRALALNESVASFHSNLGTAWFAQKKLDRAVLEYARALELDPEILVNTAKNGISARVSSPEERAKYMYLLAKLYAKRGDVVRCLQCLRKAKEEGYRKMNDVYSDEEFAALRQDIRLAEIVPQAGQ